MSYKSQSAASEARGAKEGGKIFLSIGSRRETALKFFT